MIRYEQGYFNWVDLGTTDAAAALAFYGQLFGWTSLERSTAQGTYYFLQNEGKTVAGLYAMNPELKAPPHWLVYVAVDDVDALTRTAKKAGARVLLGPHDVEEAGRMTVALDPAGAVFAMWQATGLGGAEVRDKVGCACWTELLSTRVKAVGAFYTKVFGWKRQRAAALDYTVFSVGEQQIAGLVACPKGQKIPSHWSVYWRVENLDASLAQAVVLGGKPVMEPEQVEGVGRFVALLDPQGAVFRLLGPIP